MSRIDDKNKYKHYDVNKNYTKLTFLKPDFKDSILLDHYSVIAENTQKTIKEMYPEYNITKVLKPHELNHFRDKKDIQDILKRKTNNKNELEFYESDVNIITDKFLNYMSDVSKSKFLLVGSNEQNKTVIWEGLNRYQSNRNINKYSEELEILENTHIPVSMLTLTYDHDKRDKNTAWKNISTDLRLFRQRLFYELGYSLPYLWVIESQKNGYPHIHMLFFGIEYLYYNGTFKEYQDRKKGIATKKSVESIWRYGFTSINQTKEGKEVKNPIKYVMKYVRKTWNDWDSEAILTKSLLWAYNKRSFNVSRDFSKYCFSLKPKDKKTVEIIKNPVILEYAVILNHTDKVPEPNIKDENPDLPLTFYLKKPNKEQDYTTKYECQICYEPLTVREIKAHLKKHRMNYDRSLVKLIHLKT